MSYRDELIAATKKGIGFPVAGMIIITFAAIAVNLLPERQALISIFIATGSVFPIAIIISKFFKINPFVKLPPLSNLGAILAGVQIFYWPLFIIVFNIAPAWVPFSMAILFGSHFIPYGWLYKSKAYYFIGIAMPCLGCLLALLGKEISYQYTFAALIPVYAITIRLLFSEINVAKSLALQP
jgi:hypothetical protein